MRRALSPAALGSILLHVTVAVLLLVSWPWSHDLKVGAVVPVTIVANAPSADPRPVEQAPVEQAAATPEPVPDAPAEIVPPQPEPLPVVKPAPQPPKPEPAKAAEKPAPTKPTPKPPEKALDLAALQASLSKMIPKTAAKPSSAAKGPPRAATAPEARATAGVDNAAAMQAASAELGVELQRHWHPNCEISGTRDLNPRVTFQISADGRVTQVTANGAESSSNPVVKAAAERAIRAVYEVASFHLIPRELYGQRANANYNGREACS